MPLESIIRPFQRPDSLATRRIVASAEKISIAPAIISWGKAGTLAAAHQIDAIDETGVNFTVVTCDDKYTETSRLTDVMRIEQTLPDGTKNPNNYVDLDRPYKVYFEKKELPSSRPNETQVWSTAIATANFSTVNSSQQKCQSTFNLNRNLP